MCPQGLIISHHIFGSSQLLPPGCWRQLLQRSHIPELGKRRQGCPEALLQQPLPSEYSGNITTFLSNL